VTNAVDCRSLGARGTYQCDRPVALAGKERIGPHDQRASLLFGERCEALSKSLAVLAFTTCSRSPSCCAAASVSVVWASV